MPEQRVANRTVVIQLHPAQGWKSRHSDELRLVVVATTAPACGWCLQFDSLPPDVSR